MKIRTAFISAYYLVALTTGTAALAQEQPAPPPIPVPMGTWNSNETTALKFLLSEMIKSRGREVSKTADYLIDRIEAQERLAVLDASKPPAPAETKEAPAPTKTPEVVAPNRVPPPAPKK